MSLAATHLIGFGAKRGAASSGPPTISYGGTSQKSSPAATVLTYTAVGIGTSAANRYVLAFVNGYPTSGQTVTGVKCATVSMTLVATVNTSTHDAYLYALAVTSGTTADIEVTNSSSSSWYNQNVTTYAVYGISSATAYDSASFNASSSSASVTLNVPANGVAAALRSDNNSGTAVTWTWTGRTVDLDAADASGRRLSVASLASSTLQTGMTVSASCSGGGGVLLAASFN